MDEGVRQIAMNHWEIVNSLNSRPKSWIFYEWKNAPRSPKNQVPACRGVQVTMGRHKRAKRWANSARDPAQSGRVSAHLAIESGVPWRCSVRATYGRGHCWRRDAGIPTLMHWKCTVSRALTYLRQFCFLNSLSELRFLETPNSFRVNLSAFRREENETDLLIWN